jgi:Trypsin
MSRHRSIPFLVCLLVAACQASMIDQALAQQGEPPSITMYPIEGSGDGRSSLDGGTRQDPAKWPATLKYNLGDQFTCTSTIVGEKTIITAAHCLQNGATANIRFEKAGVSVKLRCDHHPLYQRSGLINDMALCLSDGVLPTTFLYENLDMRKERIAMQTSLFLLGYGCRSVQDVGDPTRIGQLYGGRSVVDKMPTADDDHVETQGGVVICPGDSGGAAYVLASTDPGKEGGPRAIVGINSGYFAEPRVSAISTFSEAAAKFIRKWSADHNTAICGVDDAASNCRERVAK